MEYIDKYKEFLSIADEPYTGSYDDGRGNLSLKLFLDIALDQIDYMSEVLRIDLIADRIRNYVIFSQKNIKPLPKYSEKIFAYIWRNSVKDISKPTAIKIVKEQRGYITSLKPQSPI